MPYSSPMYPEILYPSVKLSIAKRYPLRQWAYVLTPEGHPRLLPYTPGSHHGYPEYPILTEPKKRGFEDIDDHDDDDNLFEEGRNHNFRHCKRLRNSDLEHSLMRGSHYDREREEVMEGILQEIVRTTDGTALQRLKANQRMYAAIYPKRKQNADTMRLSRPTAAAPAVQDTPVLDTSRTPSPPPTRNGKPRPRSFAMPGENGGPKAISTWKKKSGAKKNLVAAVQARGFWGDRNLDSMTVDELSAGLHDWDMARLKDEIWTEIESRGRGLSATASPNWSPEEMCVILDIDDDYKEEHGTYFNHELEAFDWDSTQEVYDAMSYEELFCSVFRHETWPNGRTLAEICAKAQELKIPTKNDLVQRALLNEWARLIPRDDSSRSFFFPDDSGLYHSSADCTGDDCEACASLNRILAKCQRTKESLGLQSEESDAEFSDDEGSEDEGSDDEVSGDEVSGDEGVGDDSDEEEDVNGEALRQKGLLEEQMRRIKPMVEAFCANQLGAEGRAELAELTREFQLTIESAGMLLASRRSELGWQR